ncbi:hypothetical protein A8A54_23270 [Brucella pseudogrignonensis]|uniref:hypothetical protein n=1 Tax=Brucella pseudogrignonensis TaxID=419475 RepID=UPI0007DA6042|nr:hypothetical protein [Brucella pseudogrignonensis]ANG99444.1 hypothetical protein A8A54_23270 [Brucella pseudogrignonensis]
MNFSTFIFLISASYPAYAGTFMTTLIRILALQYENAFPQTFEFALPFLMKVFVIALAVRTIKNPVMKLRYFSKPFIGLAESIRCYFIAYKSTFVLYPYLL